MAEPTYVAAVDLGSHTFCLVVARAHGAQAGFRVVDQLKERVALMHGVDPETGELSRGTLDRALAVVRRFGARIRAMSPERVRAVGTSALRLTPGLAAFRQAAADALGVEVDIIDGPTEASLTFTGAAYGGATRGRRMVVDLGGGSIECAIGTGLRPDVTASLPFGHLERTRALVTGGKYDKESWGTARGEVVAAWREARQGWDESAAAFERAIGTGGTIRAIHKVLKARGGPLTSIERPALKELERELIERGKLKGLDYEGLSERRRHTFVGGVLTVSAFFEAMGLKRMEVARHGIRDGVLHDLLGHSIDVSLRQLTAERLERRYGVDTAHGERVRALATALAQQHGGLDEAAIELLQIAARLHEIGQAVRYSGYHKEGGRILRRTELIGFSNDERLALAALVRLHRPTKRIKGKHWRRVSRARRDGVKTATFILRLAALLRRARTDAEMNVRLEAMDKGMRLEVPSAWVRDEPLLVADLEAEGRSWRQRDRTLEVTFAGS